MNKSGGKKTIALAVASGVVIATLVFLGARGLVLLALGAGVALWLGGMK